MKAQYEHRNRAIQKAGCFLLSHISFFEKPSFPISEIMIQRVYEALVEKALIKSNCYVGTRKEEILFTIGEVLGRAVKDCCYIGKWYPDRPLEYSSPITKTYYEAFKKNRHSQFCIDEYKDVRGNQHFVRVNSRGEDLYDPYPLSPTRREGQRVSTRLYYIQFEDEVWE